MRKLFFNDISIDWLKQEELIRQLKIFVISQKPHQIMTVNTEFMVLSHTNKHFKKALLDSELNVADGTGLVLAQTYFDTKPSSWGFVRILQYTMTGLQCMLAPHSLKYERITGVDLSELLMQLAAEEGWSVYLLGAKPGVAAKAGEIWHDRYPGLTIAGTSSSNPNDPDTVREIQEAKPDILLVAYGAPKQDLFIHDHKTELGVPIMVGIGGTFDTIVGTRINPPRWMKAIGLEWLAYLLRYPSRFKRIWRSTVTYSGLVLATKPKK